MQLFPISITLMLCCGLLFSGCGPNVSDRIILPVRFCVVEGASLTELPSGSFSDTGNDNIDTTVQRTVAELNSKVWIPGANMSFLTELHSGTFTVPVIRDPQPPPPYGRQPDFTTTGPGHPGDIEVGDIDIQLETQEMKQAYQSCLSSWSADKNSRGIIAVIARDLVNEAGVASQSDGVNPGHYTTVARNNGTDLCVVPRHLQPSDVATQYLIVAEPKQLYMHGDQPAYFYHIVAHELGHTLLLSHGDGQASGGTLPPNNGPRNFDQDCNGGQPIGLSLMSPSGGSDAITILQRELARDAAVLVPGHTGPI